MNLLFAAFLLVTLATGEGLVTPAWEEVSYTTPYRVPGGLEDGYPYYVCRAEYAGRQVCGKIRSSSGCIITWYNKCYTKSRYEMLVTPPHVSYKYEWSSSTYRKGNIPSNAVRCDADSYVGQKSGKYIGKISPRHKALFYDKGDCKEHDTRKYHALQQFPRTIKGYRMDNVVYDFNNSIILESEPKAAATDTTANNLDYAVDHTMTLEYSITTTNSWADVESYSMRVGASLTVKAGTPFVSSESKWEVSETSTHQQTTSTAISETTTLTKELTVPLRGGETVEVIIWIVERRISVPYTADMIVVYTDGEGWKHSVEGNYIDFDSYETGTEINPVGSDHVD